MLNRVLEITEENRYISLKRGFISIHKGEEEIGVVPLDDIAVLLITAQGATLSKNILNSLAERGCITVLCGTNYIPQSIVLPLFSHTYSTKIIKSQINISEPFKKRVWQQIVVKKIKNQALCLNFCDKPEKVSLINKIASMVKSGDPDNREAYAARMYWPSIFGPDFIRDRDKDDVNAFLNYGYAIMRAGMARAICSHGLLPALGVHHDNNLNQFCLADDFFEIYRPLVDCMVQEVWNLGYRELIPECKKILANVLKIKVHTKEGDTSAYQSMHYFVSSYVKALEDGKPNIELPEWEGNENGITLIE